MAQQKIYIYGKHAVLEALRHAPQSVRKVYLASNMQDSEVRKAVGASRVPVEPLQKQKVSSMVEGNAPHQGIVALLSLNSLIVPAQKYFESFTPDADTLLVLLSEVQDPHNVGTIIRSAAAFGASGVLLPTHRQSPITGSVIKVSAGTAFSLPLISTENMQQTIAALKKQGFTVLGFAAHSAHTISQEPFSGPMLLVFGNEASGIAPAARALCDRMLTIPMRAGVESLNVAASAAVALYAWSRTRAH